MAGESTLALVRAARAGSRDAWSGLVERYYTLWLARYHRSLGSTIHKLYDTQDLVQSAVGDALRDLPQLENDGAFFTWVTSILRHKVALRRRQLRRESSAEGSSVAGPQEQPDAEGSSPEADLARLDSYVQTLDAILELFPSRPEPMASVVLLYLEGLPPREIAARLGRSLATVYRWVQEGTDLLKARLDP
ncbi:MAG: RNA polymerase sigma factor [Planctomycetes bacterium]|nr:RNA polymerase sigma factor [Planctomycetota bacterium]